MRELVEGALRFRTEIFPEMKQLFEELEGGQRPIALFITCSDARIDPSLITQSPPGTMFIIRNAGNVVSREGAGGEGAAIEYAIEALGVSHIVLCGHYGCGAMQALLDPRQTTNLPLVRAWLSQVGEVADDIIRNIAAHAHRDLWEVAVETNVVHQLEHLRTHPSVKRALAEGRLCLYGWIYDLGSGAMLGWDEGRQGWSVLGDRGVRTE